MDNVNSASIDTDNEQKMTPEQKEYRRLAKRVGWHIWAEQMREQNPDIKPTEDNVGWEENREKQTKLGTKILKILEQEGVEIL